VSVSDIWCSWEDNIKIDLRDAESLGVEWIELAQNSFHKQAFGHAGINLHVP